MYPIVSGRLASCYEKNIKNKYSLKVKIQGEAKVGYSFSYGK